MAGTCADAGEFLDGRAASSKPVLQALNSIHLWMHFERMQFASKLWKVHDLLLGSQLTQGIGGINFCQSANWDWLEARTRLAL